jgi:hypothetical protein
MKVKACGGFGSAICADFGHLIGRGGSSEGRRSPPVRPFSADLRGAGPISADFGRAGPAPGDAGGPRIGSAGVRLPVGAGDDELKRRCWGCGLPRCLAA